MLNPRRTCPRGKNDSITLPQSRPKREPVYLPCAWPDWFRLAAAPTLNIQAPKAFDSPRHANRGAVTDLRDRLIACWPKGRTALPPKRELILTPLDATYKGRAESLSLLRTRSPALQQAQFRFRAVRSRRFSRNRAAQIRTASASSLLPASFSICFNTIVSLAAGRYGRWDPIAST